MTIESIDTPGGVAGRKSVARALLMALAVVWSVGCAPESPASQGATGAETQPPARGLGALAARASLVPTPAEERARYAAALSDELARHLGALAGVARASVIVDAPAADPLTPSAPLPRPSASVILVLAHADAAEPAGLAGDGAGADAREAALVAEARRAVAGAVASMNPADVTVSVSRTLPPRPAASLARVGPFRVAPGSRAPLLAALIGGLAAIAALALWVARVERRRLAHAGRRGISAQ